MATIENKDEKKLKRLKILNMMIFGRTSGMLLKCLVTKRVKNSKEKSEQIHSPHPIQAS